jgi:hypothetical protein
MVVLIPGNTGSKIYATPSLSIKKETGSYHEFVTSNEYAKFSSITDEVYAN